MQPMPFYLEILIALAAGSIVVMTIFVVTTAVYLKAQFDAMERSVTGLKIDVEQLVRDGKVMVARVNDIAQKVDHQMDDIQHVTSRARAWVDRADRIVDHAGPLVEGPLFFLSDKFRGIQTFFQGVLQSLKNPQ